MAYFSSHVFIVNAKNECHLHETAFPATRAFNIASLFTSSWVLLTGINMSILKRSSYYRPDYTQGAALIRARRPYLFKNLATGAGLWALVIGIYCFTLRAVGQDRFEDVKVPDAPDPSSEIPTARRIEKST